VEYLAAAIYYLYHATAERLQRMVPRQLVVLPDISPRAWKKTKFF
jgi:hypothetical protein